MTAYAIERLAPSLDARLIPFLRSGVKQKQSQVNCPLLTRYGTAKTEEKRYPRSPSTSVTCQF